VEVNQPSASQNYRSYTDGLLMGAAVSGVHRLRGFTWL